MTNTSSKGKEIKIPGPDHPITISPTEGKVRITVLGRVIADSTRALRLEEKGYPPVYYLPRSDADMSLLIRTTHYTYCPYKGDCTYYNIPIGGAKSEYAVWTYEHPYESVAGIREYLAFYPTRVDAIEVVSPQPRGKVQEEELDSCRAEPASGGRQRDEGAGRNPSGFSLPLLAPKEEAAAGSPPLVD